MQAESKADAVTGALASTAATLAMQAAADYFRNFRRFPTDLEAAAVVVRTHLKAALPAALDDAREAIECGMGDVAVATFAASVRLAGIAAAKEVLDSLPPA